MHDPAAVRHLVLVGVLVGTVVVNGVDDAEVEHHAVQHLSNA